MKPEAISDQTQPEAGSDAPSASPRVMRGGKSQGSYTIRRVPGEVREDGSLEMVRERISAEERRHKRAMEWWTRQVDSDPNWR